MLLHKPGKKWLHNEEGKEMLADAALVVQVQGGLGGPSALLDMKAHNPFQGLSEKPGLKHS